MLAFPAIRVQAQTTGVALVIGNSRYQWEAPLPNVRRDAPDIAKRFQALGLKTELLQDVGRDALRQAIDKFASASRGANLAAFYFAGHGAAWAKETYLVPVDMDLGTSSVVQSLIPVPSISAAMKEAAHRLLVFDNCRNNPADGWRQLEAERAAVINLSAAAGEPNTLVLYSTAPGRVALDGAAGENSPFAAALLRHLEGRAVDLQALPMKLRRDLLIATAGRQVLWDGNTYQQPFLLNGPGGTATNGSGSIGAPSRIVEFTKAYAFAQENSMPMPPGLIAYRPANNSADGLKVGSYKYISTSPTDHDPQLLLVLSVEEQRSAELIMVGKNNGQRYWRFVTGALSGRRIEYVPKDGWHRFMFDWRDANSGSLTVLLFDGKGPQGNSGRIFSTPFSRLDG